jgi:hypothetical protein
VSLVLLRVLGSAEVLAVLRPRVGDPQREVVIVLADDRMSPQAIVAGVRPLLDPAERASLAGQLGLET